MRVVFELFDFVLHSNLCGKSVSWCVRCYPLRSERTAAILGGRGNFSGRCARVSGPFGLPGLLHSLKTENWWKKLFFFVGENNHNSKNTF